MGRHFAAGVGLLILGRKQMSTVELGEIEAVDVSRLWQGKGLEFARWLSENLHLLGAPLHMDLELVRLEPPVTGSWFWFSILAREIGNDANVAIVHQRGESDHDSLGQLLGYTARHDVSILVWVTSNFTDDHRKSLEWLNQWTTEEIEVYGVEVQAIKIGNSLPAQRFHPVVFADAWSKRTQRALTGLSSEAQRRHDFFQPLVEKLWNAGFTNQTTARTTGEQTFPSGFPGISYNANFRGNSAWVYLWISVGSRAQSAQIHDALLRYQSKIAQDIQDIEFDFIGERFGGWRKVSLGVCTESNLEFPEEQLKELGSWTFENLLKLKEVCEPHLAIAMAELRAYQEAAGIDEGRVGETDNTFLQTDMDGHDLPNAQDPLTEENYPEGT